MYVGGIAAIALAPCASAWAAMSIMSATLSEPTCTMTRMSKAGAAAIQASASALRSRSVRSTDSPVDPAVKTHFTPVRLRKAAFPGIAERLSWPREESGLKTGATRPVMTSVGTKWVSAMKQSASPFVT